MKNTVDEFMTSSELIWFKPTKAFFDFFLRSEWKWRKFHDCGAGAGRLTHDMRVKRLDCVAYDLHPRGKSLVPVKQFDTAQIADEMDTSEVVLIARPCHHPEFIDATIESALEIGEAFYIGVPRNLGRDLVEFQYDVMAKDVGEDGEVLVRIRCGLEKYHIRRKIKNYFGSEEWWWYNPRRKRYTSEPGGLAGFDDTPGKEVEVLEEVFWANDLQVGETKAALCKSDTNIGWLAPDGEWFGCGYAQHDYIARAVLGCSVKRLEALGFCRCHGEGEGSWAMAAPEKRPTPKQKSALKSLGYII